MLCSDWQDAESMVERTSTSIAIYHEHRRLRLVVEVCLQLEHVRFRASEEIVAHTLQLLAEALQRV